jgi:hypothetical protein
MSERIHHPTLHALVSRYCAAWNESDEGRRTQMLESIWARDGVYVDPTVQLSGLPALVAHIGAVLARHPGSRIVMTSDVDAHHGILRFGSLRVRMDGTMLPEGIELAELSSWGGLQRVISFCGPLPPPVRSTMRLDA